MPSLASISKDLAQVPIGRRIATLLFIVAAMLLARFSWETPIIVTEDDGSKHNWTLPIAPDAERALYDVRAGFAALAARKVDQEKRILLVPFIPETQQRTGERSPLDRSTLADALANLDTMGAKAIGIDILFDQAQADDPKLIAALKGMKTPVWMGYATTRYNPEDIQEWQQEFQDQFLARIGNPNVRKASISLQSDPDNVLRNWPNQPRDLPPFLPVAMSGRKGAASYEGSVLYSAPLDNERDVFSSLQIDLFVDPAIAPALAGEVKDRYVLIGGDLPDVDQFEYPLTRVTKRTIAGLQVHAAMLTQALDRRLPGRINSTALWVLAIFVVLAGTFTSMIDIRPGALSVLIVGQLLFFGAAPFLFEWRGIDTQGLPAFGWIAGWVLAYMATEATVKAMGSDQKRFAQSALGKYLPPDIAEMILKDPTKLSLTGERLPIFTLFTDIQGFTSLSHVIPAEKTASILNAYLDGMSDIVLKNGGTIDKFVGDAVVAFWGAPIARDDDGDRALSAVIQMLEFTQQFGSSDSDRAMLGKTRIGLHYGEAIVGNFGGEGRIQYTALGDAMNTAARLEGANKYLKSTALVSDEARARTEIQDEFRPMGRITLSGRSTPIVVWEPYPQGDPAQRAELTRLWRQFEAGDKEALHAIEAIAAKHDNDIALSVFANRLRQTGPGGSYLLGEK
ncbi:MAG: adenylate/guanylate cyclase domain-containing protein [Pseudomonadota bacterium]